MNNEFVYSQVGQLVDEIYGCLPPNLTSNEQGFAWQVLLQFSALEQYLAGFDNVVHSFNTSDLTQIPDEFVHSHALKCKLGRRKLPSIEFLIRHKSVSDKTAFIERIVSLKMQRRITTELVIQNDTSQFLTQFVGLIFLAYEEYLITFYEQGIPRYLIRNALTEQVGTNRVGILWNFFHTSERQAH